MIYFLDNSLQLQKIVTSKNIISDLHERELNGLIRADIELDLSYANKFLVLGIDHVGYYYKDEFYLHKIQRVEYDHVNETALIVLRHVFFEDMIFGKLIQDVRPQNQDAATILRQTIEANTRWKIVMNDVTGRLSTNFYWQVPYEVIEYVSKNFRVDFFPKILFDGQKINGFQLHVSTRKSEDIKARIPFGSRVLELKYEEDFSEIITKLVGHGKGEEVGDGYGRRINISDINFSKNGVESPVGSVYMEDKTVTATYGNDGQAPREGRVVFEDIEDIDELADATYEHYQQVSRPQMLFTANVADIGDVDVGDSVMIIRREYGVYFKARIHKISGSSLTPEYATVEFGDYEHFKESKVERKTREKNDRIQNQLSDRIARLKREANDFIDGEFSQALSEFEQNYIDQKAQIAADLENMTNHIEGTRTEFTDNLNAEITQTKEYAEQQAQEKAETVRTDLGAVTSGHQAMIDSLQDNVMSIDDFLGDKTVGLNELLYNERMLFEERINSINTWHYNLLRETQSLDNEFWEPVNGTIETDVNGDRYYKAPATNVTERVLRSKQPMLFEAGETYTLSFQVQTYSHRSMDYIYIVSRDPNISTGTYNIGFNPDEQTTNVIHWGGQYRTYYITFTMRQTFYGDLFFGGNYRNNDLGAREYRIKKPYLTQSDNKQWLHNPEDSLQNLEEVTRRVTLLEDGREEFITKTQYDFETGEIEGTIKSVLETVGESSLIIQNHEDWILTNGASIERTVDGFESKAWLSDIHNPNIIPYSAVHLPGHYKHWTGVNTTIIGTSYQEWLRVRTTDNVGTLSVISDYFNVVAGQQYTVTWYAWFDTNTADLSREFDYSYLQYSAQDNVRITPTRTRDGEIAGWYIYKYKATFTAQYDDNKAKLWFGTNVTATTAKDLSFRFNRPKLEVGDRETPYHNAFSNLTQRSDEIMMAVQGIDTTGFLSQSDIQIVPDYVQLGSQRVDGNNIGSLLRVSPTGIDMVAEAMRLSGDLYVDGDITALAVDAIEGNFARLFANQLTADVITAEHIQVGTVLIDKFFATSARIDQLITKTHFVNEMYALTLNVVELNASQIRTRLLSANTIEADWIKSGTALLDRVFSSTAMFERMMAKSAFVTTLSTVTLDLHELTIWRPDGVALVMNGMERFGHPVPVVRYIDDEVETDDKTYWTNSRGAQVVGIAYGDHAGRYYNLVVGMGLRWDSDYPTQYCNVQIRTVNSPTGVNIPVFNKEITARRSDGLQWHTLSVPLGRPTYGAMTFQIEIFRRGENVYAPVEMRYARSWISA